MLIATGVAALLLVSSAPANDAAATKVVHGWAKSSGGSAMIVTPTVAKLWEVGESGILAWHLYERKGSPIKIRYGKGLDFRQVHRTCGKRAAGYPYDKYDKKAYGVTRCSGKHLAKLLQKGRVPVRVHYNPTTRTAVRVTELATP
jgi:hypothetical protein